MIEITRKNKELFRVKRDESFLESINILDKIIKKFPESNGDKHFMTIFQYINQLVDKLNDAKYYANRTIGGNNTKIEDTLEISERAYTDLIETIYLHSRSIKRMYEHEMRIQEFVKNNEITNINIIEYVDKFKMNEHHLIYENLKNMKERIDDFNLFICKLIPPDQKEV